MKRFEDIYEDKTKLKEIPPIKKPAQAKVPTKREVIPGLGKEQKDADGNVITTAKLEQVKEATLIRPTQIKDSEDAQNHIDQLAQYIDYALEYVYEQSFFKYLVETDKNFGVHAFPVAQKILDGLRSAKQNVGKLTKEISKAE